MCIGTIPHYGHWMEMRRRRFPYGSQRHLVTIIWYFHFFSKINIRSAGKYSLRTFDFTPVAQNEQFRWMNSYAMLFKAHPFHLTFFFSVGLLGNVGLLSCFYKDRQLSRGGIH